MITNDLIIHTLMSLHMTFIFSHTVNNSWSVYHCFGFHQRQKSAIIVILKRNIPFVEYNLNVKTRLGRFKRYQVLCAIIKPTFYAKDTNNKIYPLVMHEKCL